MSAILSVYLSRREVRRIRERRVFIIYNHKDRNEATRLAKLLRERGYNPWIDVDEITAGQHWPLSVERGIDESAVALFLVSQNTTSQSSFAAHELERAMKSMRSHDDSVSPVIPIRLDDSPLPSRIGDIQWVDFRKENALDEIDKGLKRILGGA